MIEFSYALAGVGLDESARRHQNGRKGKVGMGEVDCLKACPECARHVKCQERRCPFCGTGLTFFMRAPEYRLKTRLGRGATFALGAALGAAGFVTACEVSNAQPLYGAVCSPPSCNFPPIESDSGTNGGSSGGTDLNVGNQGGGSGAPTAGGAAGTPSVGGAAGTPGEGGAAGDH